MTNLTTPTGWTKGSVTGSSGATNADNDYTHTYSVTYTSTTGGSKWTTSPAGTVAVSPTGNFFNSGATAGDNFTVVAVNGGGR